MPPIRHCSLNGSLLALCFLAATQLSHADDADAITGLLTCSSLQTSDEKISCYDALAEKYSPVVSAGDEKTAATEDNIEEMNDAMGGGEFAARAGVKEKLTRGHVTSCKKSADRRWFFIFENGQVWKQIDTRKRRFKNCNFEVIIREDAFGYKMEIPERETKVRINRIR